MNYSLCGTMSDPGFCCVDDYGQSPSQNILTKTLSFPSSVYVIEGNFSCVLKTKENIDTKDQCQMIVRGHRKTFRRTGLSLKKIYQKIYRTLKQTFSVVCTYICDIIVVFNKNEKEVSSTQVKTAENMSTTHSPQILNKHL